MKQSATEWLLSAPVQAWCDKQDKFKNMTAAQYKEQLEDLINYACTELPDAEGDKVLGDAFMLIKARLGITIQSKFVLPKREA
jgi:hypothetical protein